MSNLFAALGWLLVDVTTRPDLAAAIRAGDHELAERCALESIRLAQRSIMLRAVLQPIDVDDGARTWRVEPGVTLATLLPLTNLATDDLRGYDPERWNRRRIRDGRGGGDAPRARDHVRPRRPHLSGAAVLARGHDRGRSKRCSTATTSTRSSPTHHPAPPRSAASPAHERVPDHLHAIPASQTVK